MSKKKSFFVTFEGIEGSGKSFQSKKLYKSIKKEKLPVILTREPGGSNTAEKIRKIILDDYFYQDTQVKFNKYTDTLLYLAARNEHVQNKIRPEIFKKRVIICDRFTDSTLAYQVYGKGVDKRLIDSIHKHILVGIKPDLTIILKVNILKALKRINERGKKNRYDKFSKSFYIKVQNAFVKIAKKNKKKYLVLDNSSDSNEIEKIILKRILDKLKK